MKKSAAVGLLALVVLATSACGAASVSPTAASPTTIRLRFALGTLSAQGSLVAAAPAGHNPQLGGGTQPFHVVMWNATARGVIQTLRAATTLKLPHVCAVPSSLVVARPGEVVVLCDDSCCTRSEQLVALLRPGADPVSIMHAEGALGHGGDRIDGLAGSGGLIVFNVDKFGTSGKPRDAALYRLDGTHAHVIATGLKNVGTPVGVAGGLILVERQEQAPMYEGPTTDLRVFKADGKLAWKSVGDNIPAGLPVPRILFDGQNTYQVDFYGNELRATRPDSSYVQHFCVVGAGVTLGGVSGQLVTYTTADAVHVIRTTDCHDAVLQTGGGVPVGSVITPAGVFYAFNKQPTWGMSNEGIAHDPSTLTFVPMAQVKGELQHGLDLSEYRPKP